jgi:hypothetical protein
MPGIFQAESYCETERISKYMKEERSSSPTQRFLAGAKPLLTEANGFVLWSMKERIGEGTELLFSDL